MTDAFVKFEREGREGVVAVGSRLLDVMKRLGIRVAGPCDPSIGEHHCILKVTSGATFLSPLGDSEREHFASLGRKGNVRLGCQARIIGAGEIAVMTEAKKEGTETAEAAKPNLVEEFEALPLEQKIADLVRMEAVALGETLSFVVNSPYLVIEKIGDVLAEFGMKLDREPKDTAMPPTSDAGEGTGAAPSETKKPAARRPKRAEKK